MKNIIYLYPLPLINKVWFLGKTQISKQVSLIQVLVIIVQAISKNFPFYFLWTFLAEPDIQRLARKSETEGRGTAAGASSWSKEAHDGIRSVIKSSGKQSTLFLIRLFGLLWCVCFFVYIDQGEGEFSQILVGMCHQRFKNSTVKASQNIWFSMVLTLLLAQTNRET